MTDNRSQFERDHGMPYDFSSITEVSLSHGAHKSASDGLCFMEMVAWFAGESHSDEPECACPVLGAYGICLNDNMSDDLRDRLLKPIVPLIAGTRGTLEDRRKRAEFLVMWSINKIVPLTLRHAGLDQHAIACEQAGTIKEGRKAALLAEAAALLADAAARRAASAARRAASAADAAALLADAAARRAASAARRAASAADAASAAIRVQVFEISVEGLRQAIMIGPHEGFNAVIDLKARHAALREFVGA